MPAITDRSTTPPLLGTQRLGHGTLECTDIVKTRRFYEEVLGIECIQTGPISLKIRLGSEHAYDVLETPRKEAGMPVLEHCLDVASPEDVDAAHEAITKVKDEWGLLRVEAVNEARGERAFHFQDFDGNWWKVLYPRPGGYARDLDEKAELDISGRHDLEGFGDLHVHDSDCRDQVSTHTSRQQSAVPRRHPWFGGWEGPAAGHRGGS